MTHQRLIGSIEHTLHAVLDVLSPADVRAAAGKEKCTFVKASNPTNRRQLSLEDSARLDGLLMHLGHEQAFLPVAGRIALATAESLGGDRRRAEDIEDTLKIADLDMSLLKITVDKAMEDHRLDRQERADIARIAGDLIDRLTQILDAVDGAATVTPINQSGAGS